MIKLPIYDGGKFWIENFSDLIESERKFTAIVIQEPLKISRESFEIFLSVKGANISHFTLHHKSELSFLPHSESKEFETALKFLPNLEHLELSWYNIELSEKVTMNKLKSLIVCKSDLLKFIEAPKLTKLEIIDNFAYSANQNTVAEYLMKLKNLQKLSLDEGIRFYVCNEIEFPFKLKDLKTFGNPLCQLVQDKPWAANFMMFLRHQRKYLENLQLPRNLPSIFIHEIFTTFENIKWLHLDPHSLPNDAHFFLHLKPMENVWFLKLDHGFGHHGIAEAFHALFPMLKRFELGNDRSKSTNWLRKYYFILTKYHPILEHLNFPRFTFDRDTCDFYLFKKLKSLEIMEICCFGLELIMRYRNLEKLSIESENLIYDFKDVVNFGHLMELQNIKSLKVQGPFFLLKKFYDVIKSDYKNLMTVTFETFDPIISITIEFPDHRKYFNSNIGDAFFEKIRF